MGFLFCMKASQENTLADNCYELCFLVVTKVGQLKECPRPVVNVCVVLIKMVAANYLCMHHVGLGRDHQQERGTKASCWGPCVCVCVSRRIAKGQPTRQRHKGILLGTLCVCMCVSRRIGREHQQERGSFFSRHQSGTRLGWKVLYDIVNMALGSNAERRRSSAAWHASQPSRHPLSTSS